MFPLKLSHLARKNHSGAKARADSQSSSPEKQNIFVFPAHHTLKSCCFFLLCFHISAHCLPGHQDSVRVQRGEASGPPGQRFSVRACRNRLPDASAPCVTALLLKRSSPSSAAGQGWLPGAVTWAVEQSPVPRRPPRLAS